MKGITGNPVLDAYQRMAVAPVGPTRPAERAEAGPAAQGEPSTPAAEVKISSSAYDLATDSTQAPVDMHKVESLKQRIQDGSFQVNSELIAQRLFDIG